MIIYSVKISTEIQFSKIEILVLIITYYIVERNLFILTYYFNNTSCRMTIIRVENNGFMNEMK